MIRTPFLRSLLLAVIAHAPCMRATAQEIHLDIGSGHPTATSFNRVAACRDMTGDGVPELLVGYVSFNFAPTVRVVSGADGSIVHAVTGQSNSFGWSMSGLGDVDGDGVPDFAVGEQAYTGGGIQNRGRVIVYSGADASILFEIQGPVAHGSYGYRGVTSVGDVNGDGFDDVAFGSFSAGVHVHLGPNGAHYRSHFGPGTRSSVAGIGDVDGDGHPDYIVGWPQASPGGLTWAGMATVYSGKTGAVIHQVFGSIPHNPPMTTGDHLGSSLAAAGDIDGDGIPDFVCGAPGEIDPFWIDRQGRVLVYSGADASVLLEIDGKQATGGAIGCWFGGAVAGGKDVNGDGVPDIVVGAPGEKGPFIARSGSVSVYSGRTGTRLFRAFIENQGETGRWVALPGDLDGDGLADFATGNAAYQGVGGKGVIRVWSGFQADAVVSCPASPNSVGPGAPLEIGGDLALGNEWHTQAELIASGAPPGKPALFVYGPPSSPQPFGDGVKCFGSPAYRLGPAQFIESNGTARRLVTPNGPPTGSGPGQLLPGGTWTFQLWYRDAPGAFNMSEALRVTFAP